jgi:hypothetical protein
MPSLSSKANLRELNLPAVIADKLQSHGLHTIGQIVCKSPDEMRKILNTRSGRYPDLAILEAHLYEFGLFLGEPYDDLITRPEVIADQADYERPVHTLINSKAAQKEFDQKKIRTVGDLCNLSYLELLSIKGLGDVKVRELAHALRDRGMRFASRASARELPGANHEAQDIKISREVITDPFVLGDTIQSTGIIFTLPNPQMAVAFATTARCALNQQLSEEERNEFHFAVKLVGEYKGKPAVYVQNDALARIEQDGTSLEAKFEAARAQVRRLFGPAL